MVIDLTPVNNIVIKFGGSVLYDEQRNLKSGQFTKLTDLVVKLRKKNIAVNVVIGGGKPTRKLVENLESLDLTAAELDHVSILMTRLHGTILNYVLSRQIKTRFITNYEDLLHHNQTDTVNIVSGLFPGQSTNAVAALVSEAVRADLLVNYFGYDKIHSSDPTTGGNPKPLDKLSYAELSELIDQFKQEPGHYELFDHNALNFVRRSSIPILFLNGNNPDQIFQVLDGSGDGTIVVHEKFIGDHAAEVEN